MKPVDAPEFLTFYMLLQQSASSLYFMPIGSVSGTSYGSGFFTKLEDAEIARTAALLADKTGNIFHIFPIEIPNPAYNAVDKR